ncbi:MAG: glycosyltransferase family 4 protein [Pseudomonadales bacterium]
MDRPRLLYVIESLGRGGAERALLNLIPHVIRNGYQVQIVALTSPSELLKDFENAGAEVINLNFGQKWNLFKNINLLASLVRDQKPALIHAHLFFAGLYVGLSKYFGLKQPKFITFHNLAYAPGCNPRNTSFYLRKLLNRHVVKHCMDRRIAVSSAVAEHYAESLGISLESFDIIPNGLPIPERVDKVPKKTTPEKIRIVALGRLVKEKDYDYLLVAFAKLGQKYPGRFQLQVIGGGPLHDDLQLQARKLQIDVDFSGSMAYAEAQTVLAEADIFVTASIFEGFGLSVAEAMLAGVPVVATNVGGIRDIVRPQFAEIVAPRQPEALAEAVSRVAALSETEREQRVKAAREFVEQHFSVESVAARLADLYRQQLKEAQASG